MDSLIYLLIVLLIVVPIYLFLAFVLASEARKKGHSYGAFILIGLLLSPLLGFIILIAMGENKQAKAMREISLGIAKKCPYCANTINREAIVCQFCGKDLPKIDLSSDSTPVKEEDSIADAAKKIFFIPKMTLRLFIILIIIIFIVVTITVINVNLANRSSQGQSRTVIPNTSPFTHPQNSYFTSIGPIKTTTRDPIPYSVVVDMVIGYDLNDNTTSAELTGRLYELRDFVNRFFISKTAEELRPEKEPLLKQEILEQLNTKILTGGRAESILFNQLDVMVP